MMQKLDRLQLESGALAAGEERRGLLVFKLIPAPVCRQAKLEWRMSRVETTPAVPMVWMAMEC